MKLGTNHQDNETISFSNRNTPQGYITTDISKNEGSIFTVQEPFISYVSGKIISC